MLDLEELVSEPKLVECIVEAELPDTSGQIVKQQIKFFTPDRQPLNIYLQLSQSLGKDQEASIELLQKIILNKDGKRIITEKKYPPVVVQVAAMAKVMELLGK
jgi:hypothetical protein